MALSPASTKLTKLFTDFTEFCSDEEKQIIVAGLRERISKPTEALKDDNLVGTLLELYLSGKITHHDLGILYITADKSHNKAQIISSLDEFKRSQPTKSDELIGRSKEKQELLELLADQTIHGVNIHGIEGVGKTTMANEVGKEFEQDSWEKITFDMREAKDIDTAYLFVLLALGHSVFSKYSDDMEKEDIRERERNMVLSHLQDKCKESQKVLLIFDDVESQLIEHYNDELTSFFNAIIATEACKTEMLKIIVTSNDPLPIMSSYNLQPLPCSLSKNFIGRRSKLDLQSEILKDIDEEALVRVAGLCRGVPYLLQGAEHLLRNGFITSPELLQKIETQIAKGVPEVYATTGALFESISTDNLKKLAVKLCVFTKPFSSSEVKEVADLKSDYNALLDLEFLTSNRVISKVITGTKTDSKQEYEVHSLFKECATSYLRTQFPHYEEAYNEAKMKLNAYVAAKLVKLVCIVDEEDIASVFQHDIDTYDTIQFCESDQEILENLIDFPQHGTICRVTELLESLKTIKEKAASNLLWIWTDSLENQGNFAVHCLLVNK